MPDNNAVVIGSEAPQIEESDIKLHYERVSDFKMYFCNNLQISPLPDSVIQFFFGQILAPRVGENAKIINCTQLFGVSVTLDHAKRILELLDRQIKMAETLHKVQQGQTMAVDKSNTP